MVNDLLEPGQLVFIPRDESHTDVEESNLKCCPSGRSAGSSPCYQRWYTRNCNCIRSGAIRTPTFLGVVALVGSNLKVPHRNNTPGPRCIPTDGNIIVQLSLYLPEDCVSNFIPYGITRIPPEVPSLPQRPLLYTPRRLI